MRVLFMTNCPSPYRIRFFNEVAKYCELTVTFEMFQANNRDKNWKSTESFQFKHVFLKSCFQKEEGAFCPEIKRYLKEFKNDMIIVGGYSTPTGMYSILYMKTHHIPFTLNCDGGMVKNDSSFKRKIKQFFIGSAVAWLSTGASCTRYLLHYGADKKRIYQYPLASTRENDISSVTRSQKEILRQQLGIKEEKMILFVGSFIYRKGIDILLEACWNFDNTALVLVGGTDITSFLPKRSMDPQVHIYAEGFKSEQEVRKYYQAADVFVLPTREDIWGLVVNEAMASGLPVITTDQCGAGLELIENGENGYVVPINKVQLLKEKIEVVIYNGNIREHMIQENLKKIGQYTIEAMVQTHLEILERMEDELYR